MAKRKIFLGAIDKVAYTTPLRVEGAAADAFLPGTLVVKNSDGELETSTNAATVFGTLPLVAEEYGAHTESEVDTAYTVGDVALAVNARSGEFLNVRVAAGQYITSKGVGLSSNGDGTLKIAATDGSEQVLFNSDEIVNTGASAALVQVYRA